MRNRFNGIQNSFRADNGVRLVSQEGQCPRWDRDAGVFYVAACEDGFTKKVRVGVKTYARIERAVNAYNAYIAVRPASGKGLLDEVVTKEIADEHAKEREADAKRAAADELLRVVEVKQQELQEAVNQLQAMALNVVALCNEIRTLGVTAHMLKDEADPEPEDEGTLLEEAIASAEPSVEVTM